MSLRIKITILFLPFLLSCQSESIKTEQTVHQEPPGPQWEIPPAGTVVAEYSERIKEDKINESYFKVQIIATNKSNEGKYDLHLNYGKNENKTTLELPEWLDGIVLKPALKKGSEPYQCFIGFEANDNKFHEFFEVKVENKDIKMNQTRAYYL